MAFAFSQIADAAVRVKGYYRKDGTYVSPHYRSNPDGNPYNNWSFPGNTNPYTGKVAPGDPDTYLRNYYKDKSNPYPYYDNNYNDSTISPNAGQNLNKLSHVYQYSKYLNSFENPAYAIEYAKKWDHAKVVDNTTSKVVWHNYAFHVYQYDKYLQSFQSINTAAEYAYKWDHAKIFDGLTNEVIWKNY